MRDPDSTVIQAANERLMSKKSLEKWWRRLLERYPRTRDKQAGVHRKFATAVSEMKNIRR